MDNKKLDSITKKKFSLYSKISKDRDILREELQKTKSYYKDKNLSPPENVKKAIQEIERGIDHISQLL